MLSELVPVNKNPRNLASIVVCHIAPYHVFRLIKAFGGIHHGGRWPDAQHWELKMPGFSSQFEIELFAQDMLATIKKIVNMNKFVVKLINLRNNSIYSVIAVSRNLSDTLQEREGWTDSYGRLHRISGPALTLRSTKGLESYWMVKGFKFPNFNAILKGYKPPHEISEHNSYFFLLEELFRHGAPIPQEIKQNFILLGL